MRYLWTHDPRARLEKTEEREKNRFHQIIDFAFVATRADNRKRAESLGCGNNGQWHFVQGEKDGENVEE